MGKLDERRAILRTRCGCERKIILPKAFNQPVYVAALWPDPPPLHDGTVLVDAEIRQRRFRWEGTEPSFDSWTGDKIYVPVFVEILE